MRPPLNLEKRLDIRKKENSLRKLDPSSSRIDFSSNDYLGFSFSEKIHNRASFLLKNNNLWGVNGASGSRLLTGNHILYSSTENYLKEFHNCASALIFTSGYDANIGLFSSVPGRGDIIIFDELVHASIREGIKLSYAKSFKFEHNNLSDLERLVKKYASIDGFKDNKGEIFIVTESVFSMDGDIPDLPGLVELAEKHHAFLIIDEAHATGVFGKKGEGLVQELNLEDKVFARVVTFGKAMGCHGAAVLGSEFLRDYLINFARSFIYSTGLPPHSVATILAGYQLLDSGGGPHPHLIELKDNIRIFRSALEEFKIGNRFIKSESAIQCCVIPGNDHVKLVAVQLQDKGFDVKPILSPTVPSGHERLRICLHSFNSQKDIRNLVEHLAIFIK